MSSFKNILLIGAGGSIGSIILQALLREPSFTVSVLQRASSKATSLPSGVRVIRIADDYPGSDLEAAFRGQDAVVNCITTLNVSEQYRFIDAAVAVGVRRYLPSEYGLDNMRPEAQALTSVFREKGAVQQYLRDLASQGRIEWSSISCGMWIRWVLGHDFLGFRLKERRVTFFDEGEGLFSCNTEENTALAVVNALARFPEETKNQNILLSEFATSQKEIVEEIERQLGVKFEVEKVDSHQFIAEKQAEVAAGNVLAVFGLVETGFSTGRYGANLEKDGKVFNDTLELPKHTLQDVVAEALKALGEK